MTSKGNKIITAEVSVADIDSKSAYEKVTVHVKVLRVQPPTYVSSVLRKQQVTVADATGAIKVTLWEGSIDLLKEDISYELKNFIVRMYKHEKYLSIPKEGFEMKQTNDIGAVVEDDLAEHTS